MTAEPIQILLAEDDEGHASLIKRNLQRIGIINQVIHVRDGQEVLDFLDCKNNFTSRKPIHPLLLLLDINMPRVSGVDVLRHVKADPRTAKLPVIMLTTTDDPREVARCYELGCSSYVTKPVQYEAFVDALQRLGMFLAIVKVPNEPV